MKTLYIGVIYLFASFGIALAGLLCWPALLIGIMYNKSDLDNPVILALSMIASETIYFGILLWIMR